MKHIDREFEAELERIASLVEHMSQQLDNILDGAQRTLRDRSVVLAHRMIVADSEINRTELAVDALCMQLLARRQPVASDLRFVMTVLKLVTDFERIGDLGKNVCERILELAEVPRLIPDDKLGEMLEHARDMLKNAVRAFAARDTAAARAVVDSDDPLDDRYHAFLRELLARMNDNPATIFEATRLQSIAKYIERIGDHATNVAEMVIFLVNGEDIRHARSQLDYRPPT